MPAFAAILGHIRDLRAEIARLNNRMDAIEARPEAADCPPAAARLHDAIAGTFNRSELRSLAHALEVDAEDLNGEGLNDQALALVLHMRRRGRLGALIQELKGQRPHVQWESYQ